MDHDTFLRVLAHANLPKNENSVLTQFVRHNEEFIAHLQTQTQTIKDSPSLGKELFQPLTGLSKNIYGLTNTINGFLPEFPNIPTLFFIHLTLSSPGSAKKLPKKRLKKLLVRLLKILVRKVLKESPLLFSLKD
jgi:hypothetical protein